MRSFYVYVVNDCLEETKVGTIKAETVGDAFIAAWVANGKKGWPNAEFEFDSIDRFRYWVNHDHMYTLNIMGGLYKGVALSNENSGKIVAVDLKELVKHD